MRVTLSIAAAVAASLLITAEAFTTTAAPRVARQQSTFELYGVRDFIKNTLGGDKSNDDEEEEAAPDVVTNLEPPSLETESKPLFKARETQEGKRSRR